ncbi:hypothetical protein OG824_14935 [Streptomyces prunicolor]|nr:hypothetical protein [Streptomyces prunicolor]MCX5236492.1 hypothetical protein [Streptomyces prunicolor]
MSSYEGPLSSYEAPLLSFYEGPHHVPYDASREGKNRKDPL